MAMAIETEQRQRLWLNLTECDDDKRQTQQYPTLPGFVHSKALMLPEQLPYDNPPTSMMSEKTPPKVPERAIDVLKSGKTGPVSETARPEAPERSYTNSKVSRIQLSHPFQPNLMPSPKTQQTRSSWNLRRVSRIA
jgi:hypothetical protein